jgi:signal transduction histidine kinase
VEVADIGRGLRAALDIVHARLPSGISLETHIDPIEPFMHRPGELIQVWTNLMDNAIKAMGEKGTLTVVCRAENGEAVVEVSDTGAGVPESLGNRIFDLDVTTNGPGAGLGLGLPICKNLVEQNHGGRLGFDSQPGHTTFRASIPMVSKG